jgi:hypothetical protein
MLQRAELITVTNVTRVLIININTNICNFRTLHTVL